MNPQFHDEFLALIPLRISNEISEEEWALLQIHMAFCKTCEDRYFQYRKITSDVIPMMAGVAATEIPDMPEETAAELDAAERRLMEALDSIPESEKQNTPPKKSFPWQLLVAALVLVAAGMSLLFFSDTHHKPSTQDVRQTVSPTPTQRSSPTVTENTAQEALRQANGQVVDLRKQLSASDDRYHHVHEELRAIQEQLNSERNAHKQIEAEKEAISQQLLEAQNEKTTLRAKMDSGNSDGAEQALRLATLESKVRELRNLLDEKDTELNEKDQMLALDKDFLAHDRDIRDLIGDRNLYITDIAETDEKGRTAKQFGRIFYTKDRKLIFYGFDLDSRSGHRKDVSFQVWGSGSDRTVPVSLGLFYQDDSHKRWVLRCNDQKSLARLEMVFVTVEPSGGSAKPTGKPLLRAYLQIQPNHP